MYQGYPQNETDTTNSIPLDIDLHTTFTSLGPTGRVQHSVDYAPVPELEPVIESVTDQETVLETGTAENPSSIGTLQIDDKVFGVIARIGVKPKSLGQRNNDQVSELIVIDMRQHQSAGDTSALGPIAYDGRTTLANSNGKADWLADFAIVDTAAVKRGILHTSAHKISKDKTARTTISQKLSQPLISNRNDAYGKHIKIASGVRGNLVITGSGLDGSEFTLLSKEPTNPDAKRGFLSFPEPEHTSSQSEHKTKSDFLKDPFLDELMDALFKNAGISDGDPRAGRPVSETVRKAVHPIEQEIHDRLARGETETLIKRDMAKRFSNGGTGASGGSDPESFKVMSATLAEHRRNMQK